MRISTVQVFPPFFPLLIFLMIFITLLQWPVELHYWPVELLLLTFWNSSVIEPSILPSCSNLLSLTCSRALHALDPSSSNQAPLLLSSLLPLTPSTKTEPSLSSVTTPNMHIATPASLTVTHSPNANDPDSSDSNSSHLSSSSFEFLPLPTCVMSSHMLSATTWNYSVFFS